jgi:apolipoprotein N-acyltransferase
LKQAAECTRLGPTFTQNYGPFATLKSFLNEFLIRSGYLPAIGAGLLLTAAFPNIRIAGFAWIAPALMIAAAHGKCGGDAFRVGYVAGLTHFLSSLYWLLLIPVTGFPILGWFLLCGYIGLYPAAWVWLVSECGARSAERESWSRRLLWSLAGAAVWVALEMVRMRLFSGFPWNPLGASQFQLIPLIQIASVTGVYGVSFLVVWFSLSLFSAGRMIFHRPASRFAWQAETLLPLAVVAALFAFGFARMNGQNPPGSALRITLVQPSVPQTLIWDPAANANRFQQLLELSERALTNQTDLLIWPEAAVPELDQTSFNVITNLVRTHQVWLIFNSDDAEWRPNAKSKDDFDVFNAAFLFDPEGHLKNVYHKQKLVIFGEYIPLVRWLPFIKWFTPITGSFASGDRVVPFAMDWRGERPSGRSQTKTDPREPFGDTNVIAIGVSSGIPPRQKVTTSTLICFEDAFPELARQYAQNDTDFLVNLTNDGWFGEGAAQWQQAAAAVFRAVENGLPLVRSSNNGLTCWVDVNGRLREIFRDKTGSVYGAGAMTIELPLSSPGKKRAPTFYNQHGDWFGWSCVGVTGILLVVKISGQRRKQQA